MRTGLLAFRRWRMLSTPKSGERSAPVARPRPVAGRADVGLACLRPCVTPGTRTRVTPGCCDGAEAERAPARGTSPITTPPAPAHRLLAQRRRVRSAGAAARWQLLAWVVAWRASASQASAAARWSVAAVCASSARRASRRCAARAPSFFAGAVTHRAVAQRRSRASGLTRPLAETIRSFGLGFVAVSFPPFCRGMT